MSLFFQRNKNHSVIATFGDGIYVKIIDVYMSGICWSYVHTRVCAHRAETDFYGAMYIQGQVPTEPKQMFMIPHRNGVTGGCEAPHMGSGNQSPAFCRRSISTLPLNHLSRT